MPNIAIVSGLSMQIVQMQRAIKLQANKVEIYAHSSISAIPNAIDLIYFEIANTASHIEGLETLSSLHPQTPLISIITKDNIAFAIHSIRSGASDMVFLSGNPLKDNIEIANSVYRGLKKRQQRVATNQVFTEKLYESLANNADNGDTGNFLNQMQQAVIVVGQNAKIISSNRAAEKLLSNKHNELQGRDISDLLNLSDFDLEKIFSRGEAHRGELNITHLNHEITIGYTLSPRYLHNGLQDGALMLFKDITEEKSLRLQAEKTEKMQTLGEIVAAISHEVKNPLAGIKSMIQAMLLDFDAESENYHYLIRIQQEVDRINTFIEDTFAFARHKKPYIVKVDVTTIINSVVTLLTENLKESHIEVIRNYSDDLPNLKVDPDQIHQVFLNIMLNCIEAVSEQDISKRSSPYIKISTRELDIGENSGKKKYVEINFQDNGPGFAESVFEKAFDPFFTTKPSGTGLGLSICYKIINEHYGRINLKNDKNGGAVISIQLPVNPPSRYDK
jgi:two-component system sensor histidine kinase AtoS